MDDAWTTRLTDQEKRNDLFRGRGHHKNRLDVDQNIEVGQAQEETKDTDDHDLAHRSWTTQQEPDTSALDYVKYRVTHLLSQQGSTEIRV